MKTFFGQTVFFHATGYRILQSSNPCTLKNDPTRTKTEDQNEVVTTDQIRKMEKIL